MKINTLTLKENLEKYTKIESCPIRNILAKFSGKWAILILCVLSENKTTRFNEISRAIPDISSKVLSETLKGLESNNLVERKSFNEIPPRVEYSLTPLAQSLMPKIYELIGWAITNFNRFPH